MDEAETEKQTRLWGMILHLSILSNFIVPLAGIIAPIVIWQMKKTELPGMDAHGKNAVNWVISAFIYGLVCIPLIFLLIGIPILIALAVLSVVFPIIAGIKSNSGETWKYPISIRFLK